MTQRSKIITYTLVGGVVTFFLTPLLWTPSADIQPTVLQLLFFIFLSVVESLLFGFGLWFMAEARPLLARAGTGARLTSWAYRAITWSLLSWWPHDNFHRANGMNAQGLLYIEYGFHLTLIISSIIIAAFFLSRLRPRSSPA